MHSHWKIWIDTGGTFTDCIAITPAGEERRLKILSSSILRAEILKWISPASLQVKIEWPVVRDIFSGFTANFADGQMRKIVSVDIQNSIIYFDKPFQSKARWVSITSYEEVPVLAARILTNTPLQTNFPSIELKLGSTRGTNALLERKGAKTALLVTKGFKDLLAIGTQQRSDLFALHILKKNPLYSLVIEIDERVDSSGAVLKALDVSTLTNISARLKKNKIESVAIALLHSYKNPVHEKLLFNELEKVSIQYQSLSYTLSNQIKILPRAETAVVNAYLHPVIDQYVSNIREKLSTKHFHMMSSAGGLLNASSFQPKDSLLSGPAGGVIGAISKAKRSGIDKVIGFDMGGTSTDVSLSNSRPQFRFECEVGDQRILSPAIAIETIAAGGGSICDFDGYKFTVGPHSAGASPGPACYGAGGPLTITDVNLLLGRLDERNFSIPIYPIAAEKSLNKIMEKVNRVTGKKPAKESVLTAFIQIANEKMAEAIKKVSVQQGHDPKEYALLSFGGAGGQHVCALAGMLGINKIVMPYDAGLLSAYGIGQAGVDRIKEKLLLVPLDEFLINANDWFHELFNQSSAELVNEGYSSHLIHEQNRFAYIRLKGQETSLEIELNRDTHVLSAFKKHYIKVYGHWLKDRSIEVESIRLRVGVKDIETKIKFSSSKKYSPAPNQKKKISFDSKQALCNVYQWEDLKPGAHLAGPSLVLSNNATLWIEQEWNFKLDQNNTAHLAKNSFTEKRIEVASTEATLELFTNRFSSIAYNMGALLQRTAFSVNVKERLDFSCALLDANGYLIVNAPHIPVHLGSLGACVRSVKKKIQMSDGDVVITNHPAFGGSHLPDVTLIKPVFHKKKLVGFVANRAHHAEIGGKQPGSMPADATCLEEEGVVITPTYLVRSGNPQWQAVEKVFLQAKYPTRSIHENIADLNAALAALMLGEHELKELCNKHSATTVLRFMQQLKKHAASLMQQKIQTLSTRTLKAKEWLDDGAKLCVTIKKEKSNLIIDFDGTSPVHKGNLNATQAIVKSVVLYVMRLLLNKAVPLNEGLLENVKVKIPEGMLNPKFYADHKKSPAVVGGNTEVSQRLTDTLLKALGLSACSQGTMNNLLFGNENFGYYETICGGTGAVKGSLGTDAVHQHMTNTRITDPEILEWRYPVRLERFEIRKNSGGEGKWKGGCGVEREIYFKEKMNVNILSQHRIERPYGMKGGGEGKAGEQHLIRTNGKKESLSSIDGCTVESGDRIIIKTPGGGAWGK